MEVVKYSTGLADLPQVPVSFSGPPTICIGPDMIALTSNAELRTCELSFCDVSFWTRQCGPEELAKVGQEPFNIEVQRVCGFFNLLFLTPIPSLNGALQL